jgi:hypothetical protein
MVKFLQRFSKPAHTVGVTVAVPHTQFTPTPTMSPLMIAYNKGAEARLRGRNLENPYTDRLVPNNGELATEWDKGYNGG